VCPTQSIKVDEANLPVHEEMLKSFGWNTDNNKLFGLLDKVILL
jgi:hypothetical protein